METRSNHILVGSVVIALLLALAVFIVWLSQLSGGGVKRYDIFFSQSVEGLAKGSAVTFSGVPVGQIESINLEPRTPEFVRVRIAVQDDTPVAEGSTATIQGVGFTGVSQIQLQAAPRGAPPIACPEENIEAQCPYGVPVIPTKPGALGQLLNSAPELLERLTTLTERLTQLVSDRNQASIAAILENVRDISRNVADQGPEMTATLVEAKQTLKRAGIAAEQLGQLAGTSNQLLNAEGKPLIQDLRKTIQAAGRSVESLEGALDSANPAFEKINKQTLPEVNQTLRELREATRALKSITTRIDQQGASSILGGRQLPDYEGPK